MLVSAPTGPALRLGCVLSRPRHFGFWACIIAKTSEPKIREDSGCDNYSQAQLQNGSGFPGFVGYVGPVLTGKIAG